MLSNPDSNDSPYEHLYFPTFAVHLSKPTWETHARLYR
jgi:hypothetical protein